MRIGVFAALVMVALSQPIHAQPHVVTSFAPLHSIVAGVMQGVGQPTTIIKGGASPHNYALRPSDAREIEGADLIIWVGPDYETFLARPLRTLASKVPQIIWAQLPGVKLLKAREWESHDHGGAHAHRDIDGHLFLDPKNAIVLALETARILSEIDPSNAARYIANAQRVRRDLEKLDEELAAILSPAAGKPFILFHDALQYLEQRYGLTPAGSVTVSPERRPGAQRLQRIRDRIRQSQAICVFAEPQFEPTLVTTLVEGSTARVATIDYVGVGVDPGPTAYRTILLKLATQLAACLSAS